MTKTIAQIYIDVEVKERHKIAGTNVSAVCNEFLKTYFLDEDVNEERNIEKEAQNLRARLAKANAQLTSQKAKQKSEDSRKQKERVTVAVVKLRQLNAERLSGSMVASEKYKALFDATMEEFNLSRQALADKVF